MSRKAGPAGGTNFDPLHGTLVDQQTAERTLSVNTQGGAQRSLLAFVENVAQAALKARNEFLVRHFNSFGGCVPLARLNGSAAPVRRLRLTVPLLNNATCMKQRGADWKVTWLNWQMRRPA